MKRLKLAKKNKWGATLVISLLLSASAYYLFSLYTSPTEIEENIKVYSYRQEGKIDYEVFYSPNQLVSVAKETPLRAYLTDLTKEINTDFSYGFIGQREAKLEGELKVIASVAAFTGKERYLVWHKDYQLMEPKSFSAQGKEIAINKTVKIPFANYVSLSQEIQEGTKFMPDELELSVKYYVDLKAVTDSGIITETITPELLISLKGKAFVVEGSLKNNKEDGIMAKQMMPVPMMREKRLGLAIVTGLLFVLLLLSLIFTEDREKGLSPMEKEHSLILKKYGDRIVRYKAGTDTSQTGRVFAVSSFEQLLKVADELQRPILYQEYQKDEVSFLVLAEDTYIYKMIFHLGALRGIKERVLNV